MAKVFVKNYAATLGKGKAMYIEPNTALGIIRDFLKAVSKRKQKEILQKRTIEKKNKLEILMDDPRHFKIGKHLKKKLFEHIKNWLKNDEYSPYNYKVTDAVFRLAGTGSVGLKRYVFLLKTLNKTGENYLLLDMKQAVPSSLAPYITITQPTWESDGQRITTLQTRMQNRSPSLLSSSQFKGESYVMQEMQPTKDSINFKQIKDQYRDMYLVIDTMAMLTASAQLRSSGQGGSAITDELIQFGKDESWQEPVLQYALSYSHKVAHQYSIFLRDYQAGKYSI
jgi:uncharacterized protein (DUF2252 family)